MNFNFVVRLWTVINVVGINLYKCMYVCICSGMFVLCMYVGENVCRPSLLCNPVDSKIDNK